MRIIKKVNYLLISNIIKFNLLIITVNIYNNNK